MKSIITLAATLTLAITLTLTACEEKKKQDGTTTTAPEPAAEAATPQPATAPTTFTDPRDNKTYKTIKIGEQVWMAENLNYAAKDSKCYGEGGQVVIEEGGEATVEETGEVYDREDTYITLSEKEIEANCKKYGQLYNWKTAKTACPSGWHLPSNAEWQTLVDFTGGDKEVAGKKLKAKNGWKGNDTGTDNYGFSALPGGFGEQNGAFIAFHNVGEIGSWWSTGEYNNYWRMFYGSDERVINSNYDESWLFSIRCIKD